VLYFGVVDLSLWPQFRLWVADQKQLDKMAGVCLLAFIAGLLLETYGLPVEIKEKDKGKGQRSGQPKVGIVRRRLEDRWSFLKAQSLTPKLRDATQNSSSLF